VRLYGAIALILSLATLLGWAIVLAIGALTLRSGRRGLGKALLLIGALWGLALPLRAAYDALSLRHEASRAVFDPDKYQGSLGTLSLEWKGSSTLNVRTKPGTDKYRIETTDGLLRLPAGTYAVETWNAKTAGERETTWTLETRYPRNLQTVEVKADTTAPLPVGPQLEASIEPGPLKDGSASFDFVLKDAAGNEYTLMTQGDGAKLPGFAVTDSQGQVVWTGEFEYGCGGSCIYSGKVPDIVQGECVVRPTFRGEPPFGIKTKETTWQPAGKAS